MKMFFIALAVMLAVIIPLALLSDAGGAHAAPMATLGPIVTLGPHITWHPPWFDFVVDIPDPNLDSALHEATGVAEAEDIRKSDLAALTGYLMLANFDIHNAEGIEYCTGVTFLDLSDNHLSALPDGMGAMTMKWLNISYNDFTALPPQIFAAVSLTEIYAGDNPIVTVDPGISALTDLVSLNLENCELGAFPAGLLAMDLQMLSLVNNPIGSLPEGIGAMSSLKKLYLAGCGLEALPGGLFGLAGLEELVLRDNELTQLPSDVSHLTALTWLSVSSNRLTALPDSICSMPALQKLEVMDNHLYSLPEGIGGSGITKLDAHLNAIGSLPESIGESDSLLTLNVSFNRLKSLPGNLGHRSYSSLDISYNFIDLSSGSSDRTVIDGVTATTKTFQPQLKPVPAVSAEPAEDSVRLAWEAGQSGDYGAASWDVTGYSVFLNQGTEPVELADLDVDVREYEHTGLTPGTGYSYLVAVSYHVVDPGRDIDTVLRCYTGADAETLPAATEAPTPTPAATAAPSATPGAEPSDEPPDGEDDGTVSANAPGAPPWAVALLLGLGTVAVGAGAVMAVVMIRKAKK